MKFKFKPEDFPLLEVGESVDAAKAANAKLREWLDTAPMVYGRGSGPTQWRSYFWEGEDTHHARVIEIEEIKVEEYFKAKGMCYEMQGGHPILPIPKPHKDE